MLAVAVSPHGFTTALLSEASIVLRASHREITLAACLSRVLGAEPQVRCRCLRLPQLFVQLRVARPSPNRTGTFQRIRLSSIVVILAFLRALTSLRVISVHVIGSPCSTASWHLLQSISVFRRRAIIRFTHSGFDRPGYSWSFRIACT